MSRRKLPTVGKRYWLMDEEDEKVILVKVLMIRADWHPVFVGILRGNIHDSTALKYLHRTKLGALRALRRYLENEIKYHRKRLGILSAKSSAVGMKIKEMSK